MSVVLASASARLLTLWVARPQFTGWLNHTYYYFVQVRGLLEGGGLPYPDMPLLFVLDAWVARGLMRLGLSLDSAVVASTRLVMCIVPALIPVPIYFVVRNLDSDRTVSRAQWTLILLAGFLPLSLSHLPEWLQKNMLGLLLVALLIPCVQRLLRRPERGVLAAVGLLVVATASTHYGTIAAMILYGVAIVLARLMVGGRASRSAGPALLLLLSAVISIGLVYLFDPRRFHRLFEYLAGSVSGSLLGELLGFGTERAGLVGEVVATLAFYGGLAVLFVAYRRYGSQLPASDRVFWLAHILYCGLLLLPILDERLMGRLGLFTSLPVLVVLVHMEHYALKERWSRRLVVGGVCLVVALLAAGELVSSRIHNADHREVLADLEALRSRRLFGPDDLIIAPTGAEHVSNWFFGVEAGVITSLSLDDFVRYRHVYVLNPIQGALDFVGLEGRRATNERDRYLFMRRNIPRPASVDPLMLTDHLEVFELRGPPDEWEFGGDGSWLGYSAGSAGS